MLRKVKKIILKTDHFLFRTFGSDKSIKVLENIKNVKKIFSHLNDIGKESCVRFVGGCVRKALLGEKIDDIDLATSLRPEEIKRKLSEAGFKVLDTGISHGTVTAISDKKKFEITTLRKDISTDGRHANVEFTSSWEQDALRRDFTINAIYADIDGRIFDPLNGISDLKKGIVKFIGSPTERIQEDYLRILRYLRFFTQYSKTNHDLKTIQSIKQNINGLNQISNERIFDELTKILSIKNIYDLFYNTQSKEIMINFIPQFKYYNKLKDINKISASVKLNMDPILILALLIIDKTDNSDFFCHKFKLSNKIINRIRNISLNIETILNKDFLNIKNVKKLIYLYGKNEVKDFVFFYIFSRSKISIEKVEKTFNYIDNFKIPIFPISGERLKELGYKEGFHLGKSLKKLETMWIENDFVYDEKFEKKLKK